MVFFRIQATSKVNSGRLRLDKMMRHGSLKSKIPQHLGKSSINMPMQRESLTHPQSLDALIHDLGFVARI